MARRAGVGTFSCRFSDRQALISAVALDGFDGVVAIARAAEESDAWRALTRFVHHCD
ncbi:hypothetical protein ACWEIM_06070 [Streptomyces sp. NPDC004778]